MKTINEYIIEKLSLNNQSKLNSNVDFKKEYEKIKQSADEAISLYNSNGPKQKIIDNLEDFGFNLMKLVESIKIDEILIQTDDELCAVNEKSSYGTLNSYGEPIKIIKRKNDDRIASSFGFTVNLYWKNLSEIDKLKFKMQDIEYELERPININVYKNGNIEITYRTTWDHPFFPQDKAHVQKKLNDIFKDINIEWKGWDMISKNKLSNLPPLNDALKNTFTGNVANMNGFYRDTKGKRKDLFNKFLNVLKIYDPRVSFKDTDTREKDKYVNIIGELTFKRKTFNFELLFSHFGGDHYDFYIKLDDESIMELQSNTSHWDAGFSSIDHKLGVNDKLINKILK